MIIINIVCQNIKNNIDDDAFELSLLELLQPNESKILRPPSSFSLLSPSPGPGSVPELGSSADFVRTHL